MSAKECSEKYIDSILDEIEELLDEAIRYRHRSFVYYSLPYSTLDDLGVINTLKKLEYTVTRDIAKADSITYVKISY